MVELNVADQVYGPDSVPIAKPAPAAAAEEAVDDGGVDRGYSAKDLSPEELENLRGWACPKHNLGVLQAQRRLSADDVDCFYDWADNVNISRVATFECKVDECPVILSARVENRKIVMIRDERGDCYLYKVAPIEAIQAD
jgi:hypothetical protein